MKIETSKLEGAALDWAVAQLDERSEDVKEYSPSTNWSQGGPLIEMYEVHVAPMNGRKAPRWIAMIHDVDILAAAPLIAAMRAIVAAELGDTVDVPEELLS